MSKEILLSIRPEWVAKILNGEKTIEIRKKFPKDYVGWVYIYCTKGEITCIKNGVKYRKCCGFNGKVFARFWCDKVEEHRPFFHWCIEKETCLTRDDVLDYLDSKDKFVGNPKRQGIVYAIHISNLEIFDKPKELNEFRYAICPQTNCEYCKYNKTVEGDLYCTRKSLTKAPQNYCYVESEN